MKTVLALLFAIQLSVGLRAADPGPNAGFRNLKWGDPPSEKMVPANFKHIGMDAYLAYDDDEKVAGRDTEFISYYFYKNALCQVIVAWNSPATRENLDGLTTELITVWGKADATSARGERAWESRDHATLARLEAGNSETGITLTVADLPCGRRAATGL